MWFAPAAPVRRAVGKQGAGLVPAVSQLQCDSTAGANMALRADRARAEDCDTETAMTSQPEIKLLT